MPTLREHLEAIIDIDGQGSEGYQTRLHARQALTVLDESERAFITANEYDDYCVDCGTTIRLSDRSYKNEIAGLFVVDPIRVHR